ncbi:MAG: hypothetical protein PHS60_09490, partial [Zavarzinia sp.]|nr:hypothetical protein [Zavarzinia sp.]
MTMIRFVPALLAAGLAACSGPGGGHGGPGGGHGGAPPPPPMEGGAGEMPPPVTTPAGRLLGLADADGCPALFARWLPEADTNKDGFLDRAEIGADGGSLFAAIDTDRDGFLTPVEVGAYRDKAEAGAYRDRPAPRRPGGAQQGGSTPAGGPATAQGGGPQGGAPAGRRDMERRGIPDPIMAADTSLDFRVSQAEMAAKIDARFARLDKDG